MTDPTLDEMRELLSAELPHHAAFDGWTPVALDLAAQATGIDPAIASLAFSGGAIEMIDGWFAHIDRAMLAAVPPQQMATMKIRQKIAALIEARIDLIAPDIEALRRALAILTLPQNLPHTVKLSWRAADAIWRAAGDTATDFNHYSKRTLLAGIYTATIMAMLDDQSEGLAETRAFLGRRIDGVMRFEKFKGKFTHSAPERLSLARFLGRLRYPAV
ncbi:COQ9 family protein [Sphingomonas sp.]|uniref:COQ9 family protein n=1 Tax=Sphingomonas sp. TaxID=28214 RepID=UPI0025CD246A|nr:COQ9 family protein [Sphingomonas sp.]